jgi:hypothetical protein
MKLLRTASRPLLRRLGSRGVGREYRLRSWRRCKVEPVYLRFVVGGKVTIRYSLSEPLRIEKEALMRPATTAAARNE